MALLRHYNVEDALRSPWCFVLESRQTAKLSATYWLAGHAHSACWWNAITPLCMPWHMRMTSVSLDIPANQHVIQNIDVVSGTAVLSGTVAGAGEETDGVVLVFKGEVEIPEMTEETSRKLFSKMTAGGELEGTDTFRFEELEAGLYTVVVFVIDKELTNEPNPFELARTEVVLVTLENGKETVVALEPR